MIFLLDDVVFIQTGRIYGPYTDTRMPQHGRLVKPLLETKVPRAKKAAAAMLKRLRKLLKNLDANILIQTRKATAPPKLAKPLLFL